MEKVDEYIEKLGLNQLEKVGPLKQLADKLQIKTSYLGCGVILVLVILTILNIGSFMISNMIGFLYPAQFIQQKNIYLFVSMSFKAIESQNKDDDTLWLTYWTVFAFFTIFNNLLYGILYFIPFFYLIKLIFYVWLFHPQAKGAIVVYNYVIKPVLKKYETHIDNKIEGIANKGKQFVNEQKEKLIQ